MDKAYDFVFAGGGLAGLTLALHLAQSPLRDRTMLVVDRDAKGYNDRTWCFWTDQPTLFDGIIHRSWSQFRFAGAGQDPVTSLAGYRYQMISGLDLYQFVRSELACLPNVSFLQGCVELIQDGPEGALVTVDGRIYRGRWALTAGSICQQPDRMGAIISTCSNASGGGKSKRRTTPLTRGFPPSWTSGRRKRRRCVSSTCCPCPPEGRWWNA